MIGDRAKGSGNPDETHYMRSFLRLSARVGLAFSGFLSYREFFATSVTQTCSPVWEAGTVLGYPPCIYGFIMYLAVVVVAAAGLQSNSRGGNECAMDGGSSTSARD